MGRRIASIAPRVRSILATGEVESLPPRLKALEEPLSADDDEEAEDERELLPTLYGR